MPRTIDLIENHLSRRAQCEKHWKRLIIKCQRIS
jgi:hypothetical protein